MFSSGRQPILLWLRVDKLFLSPFMKIFTSHCILPFRIGFVAAGILFFNSTTSLPVDAAEGKKLTVGLTVPTLVNPFFVGMDRGVRDRCADLGFNVIAPNANNDMATQINQMEDLITKKVDVIIICPINADAIVPAVKKANAAKIPVLALDRGSTAGDLAVFIESNNVEMGQKGADWIADHLKERYGEANQERDRTL